MSETPVELAFVGLEPGRPPMKTLRFDVVLRNESPERRWFLLPDNLWRRPPPDTGVDGMQAWALYGRGGRVIVGRFRGTRAFQTILVPAGSQVWIDGLRVGFWEEIDGGPAAGDAIVARSVTLGAEPIETWFGVDPESDAGAHVADDASAERAGAQHSTDGGAVPVVMDEEARVRVEVDPASAARH